MIRKVCSTDAKEIAAIYNEYVRHSVITFETEPVTEAEMASRIASISSRYPFLVYEMEDKVVGYCYAHAWKERAAYRHTLETTVYLSPAVVGRGIGTLLMKNLIEECRLAEYRALIACITEGNSESMALQKKLGFKQVSCFEKVGFKFGRWLNVIDYELLLHQTAANSLISTP